MANFRGFGDDAMRVADSRRRHEAQMAQVEASERASARAAMVARAGQAEQARQFDAKLAADTAKQAADTKQAGLVRADALAKEQADNAKEQANNAREERKLKMEEEKYAQIQQQWQREESARQESEDQGKAVDLAIMRLVLDTGKPVPQSILDHRNMVWGLNPDSPGAMTEAFAIKDDGTGKVYGVGAKTMGQDGQFIEHSLSPEAILPAMRKVMTPESWTAFVEKNDMRGANDNLTFQIHKLQVQDEQRAKREAAAKPTPAAGGSGDVNNRIRALTEAYKELSKEGENTQEAKAARLAIGRLINTASPDPLQAEVLGGAQTAQPGAAGASQQPVPGAAEMVTVRSPNGQIKQMTADQAKPWLEIPGYSSIEGSGGSAQEFGPEDWEQATAALMDSVPASPREASASGQLNRVQKAASTVVAKPDISLDDEDRAALDDLYHESISNEHYDPLTGFLIDPAEWYKQKEAEYLETKRMHAFNQVAK